MYNIYRLLGREPAGLFKHFGRDVDSNCLPDETRHGQRGMPCSGGYIKVLITVNRLGERQQNGQTRARPVNIADRVFIGIGVKLILAGTRRHQDIFASKFGRNFPRVSI
jgi:hypothetical protein